MIFIEKSTVSVKTAEDLERVFTANEGPKIFGSCPIPSSGGRDSHEGRSILHDWLRPHRGGGGSRPYRGGAATPSKDPEHVSASEFVSVDEPGCIHDIRLGIEKR